MDLESFIITVFCTIDDFFRQSCPKLRQRGPAPRLADSEVLTIEAVGEFLHIDTDRELYAYFRRHFGDLFPGLLTVHRTTFARQAANLWVIKSRLWRHLAATARQNPALTLIDSLPVLVCHFARAHRCRGFPGIASFGHDALAHQTYYGLRLHLCVTWPGVITAATLAPADAADLALAPRTPGRSEGVGSWGRRLLEPAPAGGSGDAGACSAGATPGSGSKGGRLAALARADPTAD
jgi:hypothetical protein